MIHNNEDSINQFARNWIRQWAKKLKGRDGGGWELGSKAEVMAVLREIFISLRTHFG